MKKINKVKWHKPQMIVLVRSNPEEHVLNSCKKRETHSPGWPNCSAGESFNRCFDPGNS